MTVIVTGGSGKAGRYTVAELAEAGHEVVNLDLIRPEAGSPGRFIEIDLADAGEVFDAFAQVRPEGVCHIAANPSPGGYARNTTFENNVISTYHVMQAAGDFGARRLIYAGSEMATGWLTTDELPARFPFNEADRVPSPNGYAMSKYTGEVIADGLVRRYPQMSIATLRINNIVLPERYVTFPERRANYPAGSSNFWSYIDVRDVAGAFRSALEGSNEGHEVFLIAAADTWIDQPTRKALTDRFGETDQFAGVEFEPGFGEAGGDREFESAFDCRKMRRYFGWKPRFSWRDHPEALEPR